MADESRITEVEIFGSAYTIKSEENPEYVHRLAGYVDEKMREIGNKSTTISTHKVAILTAINIADELFKALEDNERLTQKINEWSENLAKKIDKNI